MDKFSTSHNTSCGVMQRCVLYSKSQHTYVHIQAYCYNARLFHILCPRQIQCSLVCMQSAHYTIDAFFEYYGLEDGIRQAKVWHYFGLRTVTLCARADTQTLCVFWYFGWCTQSEFTLFIIQHKNASTYPNQLGSPTTPCMYEFPKTTTRRRKICTRSR